MRPLSRRAAGVDRRWSGAGLPLVTRRLARRRGRVTIRVMDHTLALTQFQEAVQAAPERQERLRALLAEGGPDLPAKVAAFAAEIGTPVPAIGAFSRDAELSEADLTGVAGGVYNGKLDPFEQAGKDLSKFLPLEEVVGKFFQNMGNFLGGKY